MALTASSLSFIILYLNNVPLKFKILWTNFVIKIQSLSFPRVLAKSLDLSHVFTMPINPKLGVFLVQLLGVLRGLTLPQLLVLVYAFTFFLSHP